MAMNASYNDDAKCDLFKDGLKESILDKLAHYNMPATLEQFIAVADRINQ